MLLTIQCSISELPNANYHKSYCILFLTKTKIRTEINNAGNESKKIASPYDAVLMV